MVVVDRGRHITLPVREAGLPYYPRDGPRTAASEPVGLKVPAQRTRIGEVFAPDVLELGSSESTTSGILRHRTRQHNTIWA